MAGSHVAGWTSESPTPAQLKEFFSQVASGRITKARLQAFLRSKADSADVSVLLADWQGFYRDLFGIVIDLSVVHAPTKVTGFDRLIVVAHGMDPQRLHEKAAELFPCWKHTKKNLDEVVQSERTSKNGPYVVWFRDRIEADEELKKLSADQLKEQMVPGITLGERLLYELKYFNESGEHLDVRNITLCAGSRDSDGDVPGVFWLGGKLFVSWFVSGFADGGLRSRAAVS